MESIDICTLGTASGFPACDRFGQTIVVTRRGKTNDDVAHYLLDTGDGASSLLMRHGVDHRRIRGIVISHMHADHHGGFAQVIKTCMHLDKKDELVICAPQEGITALQAYLDVSYLFEPFVAFPLRWIALAAHATEPVRLDEQVVLQAYPNNHLAPYRRWVGEMAGPPPRDCTFESYSIALQWGATRLVYSGNLDGPSGADEMAGYCEPCSLLVCELAHVDPEELGRFLAGRAIEQTVVTHFHPRWDGVADTTILALIARGAGAKGIRGRVLLARDGDTFACARVA